MQVKFCKNQYFKNEPYWFDLGICLSKLNEGNDPEYKYVFIISLFFWRIDIRWK